MNFQDELQAELRPITVSLGNLLLDPNNFRLAKKLDLSMGDKEFVGAQRETLEKMIKGVHGIQDLESSILNHGWLDVDQIVVRRLRIAENQDYPRYVVVEGNRRIAALLKIVEEHKQKGLPLPPSIEKASKELRVMLIIGDDEDVDRASDVIMGIRHLGGPRKWGGLQASMMVAKLVDYENLSFSDVGRMLGITSIEAGRRYRSYKAYEQARERGYEKDNQFALLEEAVRIKSVREWLEWDEEKSCFKNENRLNLYYEKIGLEDETKDVPKEERISNPQSARSLRKIVEDPLAAKVFEQTRSLENARIIASHSVKQNKSEIVLLCQQLIEILNVAENLESFSAYEKEILVKLLNKISDILGGKK